MSRYVIPYAASLAVLLVLDFIWLGLVMRGFYKAELGDLLRERPHLPATLLFYAIYVVGLTIFATVPAIQSDVWTRAVILGGLFGFFAYFTYDMVNFATLKAFPLKVVFVDVAWGIVVSGAAATAGFHAGAWFQRQGT